MTKRDSTRILWRVQVRRSRTHKWVNKGTFETREDARQKARYMRDCRHYVLTAKKWTVVDAYGFGNTRVVRIVKE